MTNWNTICVHLQKHGLTVYPPGHHQGKCTAPYLVLKDTGTSYRYSTEKQSYDLMVYAPADDYPTFRQEIQKSMQAMDELFPALRLTDGPDEPYFDTDKQAYMSSLYYRGGAITKRNRFY